MLRVSRLKAFVSVFSLLPFLGVAVPAGHSATAVKGTGDAASCRAMTGRPSAPTCAS